MSVFGLTQGWQRQPWAKTGERRRRYIRLGWNWRTPKALHTLGLELANAEGVTYPGLERANAEALEILD